MMDQIRHSAKAIVAGIGAAITAAIPAVADDVGLWVAEVITIGLTAVATWFVKNSE